MIYSWANVENPFFWLFWSGLFLGAAVSRAFKPRLRFDRWALVYLYLIIVVAAATLAFIAPQLPARAAGAGAPLFAGAAAPHVAAGFAPASLVFVLAMTGLGFLAAWYRRAAGIPALVALVLVVAWSGASLRGASPFLGSEAEAGEFRVLAFHNGTMDVEIDYPGGGLTRRENSGPKGRPKVPAVTPSYETLHGSPIAAVVPVLIVPDWFFFLSSVRYYRPGGLVPYDPTLHAAAGRLSMAQRRVQSAPFRFPAIRATEHLSSPLVPTLLQSYHIVLLRDLAVRVAPVPEEKD